MGSRRVISGLNTRESTTPSLLNLLLCESRTLDIKFTLMAKKLRVPGCVIKQTFEKTGSREMAHPRCPKVCSCQLSPKIQDNYSVIFSQGNLFQIYKWGRNVIIFKIEWTGILPVKPTLQLNFILNWSSCEWMANRAKALLPSSKFDLLSCTIYLFRTGISSNPL